MKAQGVAALLLVFLWACGGGSTPTINLDVSTDPGGQAEIIADAIDIPGEVSPEVVPVEGVSQEDGEAGPGTEEGASEVLVETGEDPGVENGGTELPTTPCTTDQDCEAAAVAPCHGLRCASGQCEMYPLEDGTPCDTGSVCELNGACISGLCIGTPLDCDDNNPCTDDSCDPKDGCRNEPNSAPCDDQNPCTLTSTCKDGVCVGHDNQCQCTTDADCAEKNDDDLCNGVLHCVQGYCEVDPSTVVKCLDQAADLCHTLVCEPKTGQCVPVPVQNGTPCDDGSNCTALDQCLDGQCVGGSFLNCDDSNPCTDDSCDPVTGCMHTPNSAPCDDKDFCTIGDICLDGKCVGLVPRDCSDGNPCTDDRCEGTSCIHAPNNEPCDDKDPCTPNDYCDQGLCVGHGQTDCDDGNQCTLDVCDPGSGCVHKPLSAVPCDDGNACTAVSDCVDGVCVGGTAVACDDNNICTDDSCDPIKGCVFTPNSRSCDDKNLCTIQDHCEASQCVGGPAANCDDMNPCTDDSCDPAQGCVHIPNSAPCDDGSACTTSDTCVLGQCIGGPPLDCDDKNVCTTDSCDPISGCVHAANTLPCDDGNACTEGDRCNNKQCQGGGQKICMDGNPCTLDDCDPKSGCVFRQKQDGTPCDDGNSCTSNDKCFQGHCVGEGMVCSDGNPCTDDRCDQQLGCYFVPNTNPCDDNDKCTEGDVCSKGTCSGKPISCDDGNVCTEDLCDKAIGCYYQFNTKDCEDGNLCTLGDKCQKGLCIPGTGTPNCDDNNLCTTDSCDPKLGCRNVPNTLPCNDGDVCTENDRCSEGKCKGTPVSCDDNNVCTKDLCVAGTGCMYQYVTGPCDDGNKCTTDDKCLNGQCVGGGSLVCDDKNPCTTDSCDPIKGCVYTNNTLPCDDGKKCTTKDQCSEGKCVGGPPPNCDDGNPCTDDGCAEPDGCYYKNNTNPCDDKNACTGPDRCSDGVCSGSAISCDDNNECTSDWCDKTLGCQHASLPVGTPCSSAGKYGMCIAGRCLGWEFKTSNPPNEAVTRLYEGGRPVTNAGLFASGGNATTAVIYAVNTQNLTVSTAYKYPGSGTQPQTFFAQFSRLAGGSGGISAWYTTLMGSGWTHQGAPNFDTFQDILSISQVPQSDTYIVTGKAPMMGVQSTVRRCWVGQDSACLVMGLVANKQNNCTQKAVELRGSYVASATRAFAVGFEQTMIGFGNLVIASWDGNTTAQKCADGAVFYGAFYYDQDNFDLVQQIQPQGPGALNDVHGSSQNDVWAVGERGSVFWFDGKQWSQMFPANDLPKSGYGSSHYAQSVWVDSVTGVHIVGTRYVGDCQVPFYLHAVRDEKAGYKFNNYMEFVDYQSCSGAYVNLSDLYMDPVTSALYAFGWFQSPNTLNVQALVMRIQRPQTPIPLTR